VEESFWKRLWTCRVSDRLLMNDKSVKSLNWTWRNCANCNCPSNLQPYICSTKCFRSKKLLFLRVKTTLNFTVCNSKKCQILNVKPKNTLKYDISVLLGCYAMLLDVWFPTFRDNVVVSSFKMSKCPRRRIPMLWTWDFYFVCKRREPNTQWPKFVSQINKIPHPHRCKIREISHNFHVVA
jgi:hypothetical protein